MPCKELLRSASDSEEEKPPCLKCPPTVEGGRSRAGVGRGRVAPRGSAPPCRDPRPNDVSAEVGLLPPRARPRARGRVFAPSPTLFGPFAPQRVAAAYRGDVAEGFEASCCLPLAMAVRTCTCTCDCTATVTPTAVGEHEMGSKGSAAKTGGHLEPPSTLAPCCAGSTATVGSRVCDFACSTDAGVELPTSLTRPVPTSDADRPLSLAVKEPVSSRGHPPPGRRSTLGPRWVNRGSPIFGGQPWVPAQKSSSMPSAARPHCILPARNLETLTIF